MVLFLVSAMLIAYPVISANDVCTEHKYVTDAQGNCALPTRCSSVGCGYTGRYGCTDQHYPSVCCFDVKTSFSRMDVCHAVLNAYAANTFGKAHFSTDRANRIYKTLWNCMFAPDGTNVKMPYECDSVVAPMRQEIFNECTGSYDQSCFNEQDRQVNDFNAAVETAISERSEIEILQELNRFNANLKNAAQQTEEASTEGEETSTPTKEAGANPETSEDNFEIPENKVHVSATQDANLDENEFYKQLEETLAGKAELSSEQVAAAIKSYKAKLANLKEGQAVSVDLPKDSMIQNLVLVPAKPIKDDTISITVIDEEQLNKAVPLLGGKGIIGNPDYPIPDSPAVPVPEKYTLKAYVKIDAEVDAASAPRYKEGYFHFLAGIKEDEASRTKFLHYDNTNIVWGPTPSKYDFDQDKNPRFTAKTPSFSYFAIVVEKEQSIDFLTVIAWLLIIIMIAPLFIRPFINRKQEKSQYKDKPGTARFIFSELFLFVVFAISASIHVSNRALCIIIAIASAASIVILALRYLGTDFEIAANGVTYKKNFKTKTIPFSHIKKVERAKIKGFSWIGRTKTFTTPAGEDIKPTEIIINLRNIRTGIILFLKDGSTIFYPVKETEWAIEAVKAHNK
jgi:hypothetical protein